MLLSAVLPVFQTLTASTVKLPVDGGDETRASCTLTFRAAACVRLTWDRLKWNSIFRSFLCVCIVHLGAGMTLSRDAGFILPAARRRQRVRVLRRAYTA